MNKYTEEPKKRSQTLLIVEGKHEKNELFWLIFKCFPEIDIDMDNVWIYGTNIYRLYEDIINEYGETWAEDNIDIDLPFIISKKQTSNSIRYKEEFTDIILVFDYERHDPNFSENKILKMQSYFLDATDMGKLYINYPMIESYLHLKAIPDVNYEGSNILVSLQPGKEYKNLVKKETVIYKYINFIYRLNDLLKEKFGITDDSIREKCIENILNISSSEGLEDKIDSIFQNLIETKDLQTLKYQLIDWINNIGYVNDNKTYWLYMRKLFKDIIYHNIAKANRIQNGVYSIEYNKCKDYFSRLDHVEILKIQNQYSNDKSNGIIWILNTCVFVVPDYNYNLLKADI